jgi:hypothetical protein
LVQAVTQTGLHATYRYAFPTKGMS